MSRPPAPALSPAEAARVALFDAAPTPPECDPERVETVARALFLAQAEEGGYLDTAAAAWDVADVGQAKLRRLAAAAIAALPPSPAEEAVKRVEALAEVFAKAPGNGPNACALIFGALAGGDRAKLDAYELRFDAALASPAPAPQDCGCEQGMGHMDRGCHSYGLCHAQSAERGAR